MAVVWGGGGTEDKGPKNQRAGTPGKGREGVNPSPGFGDWGFVPELYTP